MAPPKQSGRQADLIALLALVVGGLLLAYVVLVKLPTAPGFWMDDGVYLATGKALAEGKGYRHVQSPGMPWQTKYPPLYPMVLAVLWKTCGGLGDVLRGAAVVNVVCWVGAAMIAYGIARRQWRMPAWLACAAGLMVIIEPQALDLHNSAMSEALFTLLSVAALGACGEALRKDAARSWVWWGVACAVLAGLSVATRSIGVACVGACIGGAVLARRWTRAGVIGITAAVLVGGFMLWRSGLAARNASIPEAAHLGYDLDYKLWLAGDVSSLGWSAWINSGDLLLCVTQRVAPWPGELVQWCIEEGWVTQSLYLAWCALVWGCIGVGLSTAWKRSNASAALYIAGSMALLIVWPFPPSRFVMPLVPVLAPAFVLGLATAVGWIVRALTRAAVSGVTEDRSRRIGALGGERVATAVAIIILGHAGLLVASIGGESQIAQWGKEFEAGVALVREKTPTDGVVAAPSAALLYLKSDRKAVILAPADAPVSQRYPKSRTWRMMGIDADVVDEAYFKNLYETRLEAMYDGTGVTHVLVPSLKDARARLMAEYFRSRGARYSLVADIGTFRLYEVHRGFGGG